MSGRKTATLSSPQVFANVPFTLLDPSAGPVCILLGGGEFPKLAVTAPEVPVNRNVSYLYFLHHAGWMNSDYDGISMEYLVHYADGTCIRVPIHPHFEISDSVNGGNLKKTGLGNPEAKVAFLYKASPRYPSSALYAYRWKNPQRDKMVTGIGFSSKANRDRAVSAIYAITAELAK